MCYVLHLFALALYSPCVVPVHKRWLLGPLVFQCCSVRQLLPGLVSGRLCCMAACVLVRKRPLFSTMHVDVLVLLQAK